MQRARDGSVLWWGTADTPGPEPIVAPGVAAPVSVAVSPPLPGHSVTVEYRIDGGPVQETPALAESSPLEVGARVFRAMLPGQAAGLIEYIPVLRFVGRPISARLEEQAQPPRYQVRPTTAPIDDARSPLTGQASSTGRPRWDWEPKFLGCLTAIVYKEV
ncbi:MAG: hypothetical protein ABI969_14880, partial [bacterium]